MIAFQPSRLYRFMKVRNQTVFLPVGQSRIAISGIELNERDAAGYESVLMGNRGYPEILLSHNQFDLGRAVKKGDRRIMLDINSINI